MKARVVIADDHPITITGTVAILRGDDALDVVGEATDGAGTLALCRELRPDLLLLDVRLPDMSGIAVARAVRAMPDPPRVLMLSAYPDGATVRAALEAGAAGYVLKSVAGPALLTAIRRVLEGEQVLLSVDGSPQDTRAPLSPQELAVLSLVAEGLTSRAIAACISTPDHTLSAHRGDLSQPPLQENGRGQPRGGGGPRAAGRLAHAGAGRGSRQRRLSGAAIP